jgi:SNF2 family DNA or RNA helicase
LKPEIGQVAWVRSRRHLVEDVERGDTPDDLTVVALSCLEDDAQGEQTTVLWEKEIDARLIGASRWDDIAKHGFDKPHLFSAYLHTLRWNCVTSTNPELFQSPYRAGIEIKAYQLEPLRLAIQMPRVNLFIADDVGLGKTIEAGLIVREMLMRQKVNRIVISCPPSVVLQWRDEMESRFGLNFVVYDRDFIGKMRYERGWAVNPWTTHNRFIISHALLRDEAYAGPLRIWLEDFSPGSMLILDEAHNAAPAHGSKYAIDSHLTKTVRDIAPRFEHRLFLSATPHNGHSNSFSALLEILDPQRFCRGVPVDAKLRDEVMVRRLKDDLRQLGDNIPLRHVEKIEITGLPDDAPELVLSHLLQEYRALREKRLRNATRSVQNASGLVLVSLQKRLLSSIEAFDRTLRVHRRSVEKAMASAAPAPEPADEPKQELFSLLVQSPGVDDERAEVSDKEIEAEEDKEVEKTTRRSGIGAAKEMAPELAMLDKMAAISTRTRQDVDPKVKKLVEWIRESMCPDMGKRGAKWNDRRVLIFTEYTDSKRYLKTCLEEAIAGSDQEDERIAVYQGTRSGTADEGREKIKKAFNTDPQKHPLRILIATDAAREGVNLQNHCYDLFHFDVPWNPSRMEQRNGRIDRRLQRSAHVYCRYFVIPQRPEDRVMDALVKKTKKIIEELGSLSPVIDRGLTELLDKKGIRYNEANDLEKRIDGIDKDSPDIANRIRCAQEELEETRRQGKLKEQLDRLQTLLKGAKDWINLSQGHFLDALSASLEVMHEPGIKPINAADATSDPETAKYRFPALDRDHDLTWASTLDSLRVPRDRDQKIQDWRRTAPLRPIVFRDPGNIDNEVVHLHLEHRIVQRLLGRFLAQGFVQDELTRACVCLTDDPVPRVVLLGRLSLYGQGAARLHDEIIAIPAQWSDPVVRGKSKLSPLASDEKAETLALVEKSLLSPRLREVPERIKKKLIAEVARDVREMKTHLDRIAKRQVSEAQKKLAKRGEAEAKAMEVILRDQRARIVSKRDEKQLTFDEVLDKRQYEADRRHWDKRLAALSQEMVDEPKRIRAAYEVKAERVEPVGVVYLWPVSS